MQRLLKALRRKAAERLVAEMALSAPTVVALLPGAVDGAAYRHSAPPTALPSSKARKLQEASHQTPPYLPRQGNISR